MRLDELTDNKGATQAKKRVGRGPGSGTGKTAGRGVKGQKSRSGVAIKGFEGGQMPIHMRLPKRGFNNPFAKEYNEVNLARVQLAIDSGKLDAGKTIDAAALLEAGVIRRIKDGVRLLGKGEIKTKAEFEVAGVSAGAAKAVEAAGGTVSVLKAKEAAEKAEKPAKKTKKKTTGKKSEEEND